VPPATLQQGGFCWAPLNTKCRRVLLKPVHRNVLYSGLYMTWRSMLPCRRSPWVFVALAGLTCAHWLLNLQKVWGLSKPQSPISQRKLLGQGWRKTSRFCHLDPGNHSFWLHVFEIVLLLSKITEALTLNLGRPVNVHPLKGAILCFFGDNNLICGY
jgi:hypothetical protein